MSLARPEGTRVSRRRKAGQSPEEKKEATKKAMLKAWKHGPASECILLKSRLQSIIRRMSAGER